MILAAYDDACNLVTARSFVKAVDIFRRVELRPLSKNRAWLLSMKIDPEDAQKDFMRVQTDRNNLAVKGYEFYAALSSRLLLLLPLSFSSLAAISGSQRLSFRRGPTDQSFWRLPHSDAQGRSSSVAVRRNSVFKY